VVLCGFLLWFHFRDTWSRTGIQNALRASLSDLDVTVGLAVVLKMGELFCDVSEFFLRPVEIVVVLKDVGNDSEVVSLVRVVTVVFYAVVTLEVIA